MVNSFMRIIKRLKEQEPETSTEQLFENLLFSESHGLGLVEPALFDWDTEATSYDR